MEKEHWYFIYSRNHDGIQEYVHAKVKSPLKALNLFHDFYPDEDMDFIFVEEIE